MTPLFFVMGLLALAAVPLAEVSFEDNSLSGEYCTVDCGDILDVFSEAGALSFDGARTFDLKYEDTEGRDGTITIGLISSDISLSGEISLQCRSSSGTVTLTGEFLGGECYIDIDDVPSGSTLKVWGTLSDSVDADFRMTVTAVPDGCHYRSVWKN